MKKSFANIEQARLAARNEFINRVDLLTRGKRHAPLVWRVDNHKVVFGDDMYIRDAVKQITTFGGYHYDDISLPLGHFGSGVIIHADFMSSTTAYCMGYRPMIE